MSIMLANFGKYAISDCPFICLFVCLSVFFLFFLCVCSGPVILVKESWVHLKHVTDIKSNVISLYSPVPL